MSADKRKVSTDALETLGTIITPDEKRDAIHLAVIPMQAPHALCPGDHVDAQGHLALPTDSRAVGIVDPFLTSAIEKGQWFWLVIYPRKITSLRHVWSHPAFPEEEAPGHALAISSVEGARKSLEEFAAKYGTTLGNLLEQAERVIADTENQFARIHLRVDLDYDEQDIFWPLWETYTGRKAPDHVKERNFSCSC